MYIVYHILKKEQFGSSVAIMFLFLVSYLLLPVSLFSNCLRLYFAFFVSFQTVSVTFVFWSNSLALMEDLSTHWKKLSLSESEENWVALRIDRRKRDFILAGKFFTRRSLNIEAVAKTFRPLWCTKRGFNVTVGGENILLFAFELEVDAERVVQGLNDGFENKITSFNSHATKENSLVPRCVVGFRDDEEHVSSSLKLFGSLQMGKDDARAVSDFDEQLQLLDREIDSSPNLSKLQSDNLDAVSFSASNSWIYNVEWIGFK
ncbi:hypothetical protein CFP56_034076 [Quercus suber]|uniref:DUF4283 domain-containing protein n=1 Tax=Quercus suber TaxID=58331 RepID=A0AAW0JD81_QUESU